jgi:hypothetical protein
MSDSAKGAPPPTITTTPPKSQGQGKGQRTPSAAQGKRNNRGNNNNNARKQVPHIDGAVSDSVASNYPQARRPSRQGQCIAQGAYLQYSNNQNGETNGQRMRPVSMGGPMLPGTPAKERAYAQSTFQASPAASALPVPKFFGSKSVPNVNVPSSLQARMDGEKTPDEPQESSPEPEIVSPIKQSHGKSQTPLDMFFMADKAEKERKNSPGISHLSPDLAVRPSPASEPRNPFQTNRQSPFTRGISEAAQERFLKASGRLIYRVRILHPEAAQTPPTDRALPTRRQLKLSRIFYSTTSATSLAAPHPGLTNARHQTPMA